jgi:hypothetical protein
MFKNELTKQISKAMKKLLSLLLVAGMALTMTSCGDDDSPVSETCTDGIMNGDETGVDCGGTSCTACTVENTVKAGLIIEDETWTADRIYELDRRVIVADGATLTIEAGTIIKGQAGEAENASVLIVARGGKINAIGTAAAPIIFTTTRDDIAIGETASRLTKIDNNAWGGIIILGYAPISAKAGDDVSGIEGLPADEDFGKYGGTDAADNSGTLKYVSIRHGGITIGDGNEINGLTLGGVGNGTTIDQVEVFATVDDGIEFFGGTVNVTNVVVAWQGDDGIDIDQNYSGTVTNFVVTHGAGVGTDEGLEIDGPEGTLKDGKFTLVNGTVISDGEGSAADLKSDAQGTLDNILFEGYASAIVKVEGEYDQDDCTDHATKAYTDALQNLIAGDLVVQNSKLDAIKVTSKQNDDKEAKCGVFAQTDIDAATNAVTIKSDATGADKSVFSWTAAFAAGLL